MTAPMLQPLHEADLEAFLDFVNTLSFADGRPEEGLPTPESAIDFLARRAGVPADRLAEQAGPDRDAWLRRVHGVRAALREAWDAQVEERSPDPGALATVNEALRGQPSVELRAGPTGVGVARSAGDDPAGEALARLIEPFVDAVVHGDAHRFRVCANDGCRWVFEDTSRGGRRRWCDMASCGNRAKVARYRERRRRPEAVASDESDAAPGAS